MSELLPEDASITLKDKSVCSGVRADLKMCLLRTDCCQKQRKTPRECIRSRDPSVPDECFALYRTFFECKRSLIDGRLRFKGPRGY